MAQAQLLQAAAEMESLQAGQEELEQELQQQESDRAAWQLQSEMRQEEESKLRPLGGNVLPSKHQRIRQVHRPTPRSRKGITTGMMTPVSKTKKLVRTPPRSARAMASKPSRRAPRKILPKVPMQVIATQPQTEPIAIAAVAANTDQAMTVLSNSVSLPFTIKLPDLSLPAPTHLPILDPTAVQNSHERALLFFGLYFDMHLAPAIESQSLCDPSHYHAPADAAALVLGPMSVSRTHLALFKFQILQSFATLLTAHSTILSLDSLFQHFLACCISHGLVFA